jgi:hypothetical protein
MPKKRRRRPSAGADVIIGKRSHSDGSKSRSRPAPTAWCRAFMSERHVIGQKRDSWEEKLNPEALQYLCVRFKSVLRRVKLITINVGWGC